MPSHPSPRGTSGSLQGGSSPRRRGAYILVAVAVVIAILAGALVPLYGGRRHRHAAQPALGPAGTVQIVSGSSKQAGTVDIGTIASALLEGNKLQPPVNATAPPTASAAAGAPSPSPVANGGKGSSIGAGLFSGLLGGGGGGGGGSSMASAPTAAASTITTRGWAALEAAGATVCNPRNGSELVQMVTRGPCTIIVLRPSATYNVSKVMNVTSTKIIVGNPVFLPTLTPTKGVPRLFEVYAGGRLDIRAAFLYRGESERFDEDTLRVLIGTHARVFLGGSFSASWCIFTQKLQTLESFMNDLNNPRNRIRQIGGFVLVLGGNVNFVGCIMYRFIQYGLPIINNIQIGRDILVVAGNCVLVGFYDMLANLLAASVNVGNVVAVLGGTVSWVGGAVANAGVVNGHWGAGQLVFVGGGTLVTVGVANVGSFMAIMRSGFGQFGVGAGVLVHIGHLHPRAWGVATVFNAGQTHSVGAGVYHKTGGVIATTAINFFFAGAGGQSFVGTGDLTWIGATAGRSVLTQSQSGLGGQWYNGAGDINFVGLPAASVALLRVRFMLGGEQFTGGGFVNWIHCRRFGVQLLDAFFGLGTNLFLGGGGVVFYNSESRTIRRKYFPRPKVPGAIWVGGTKVPAAGTNNNIYVDGSGVTPIGSTNKTSHQLRHFLGRNRRRMRRALQQQQQQQQQQQDAVTPTVAAIPGGGEAGRNSLLLIKSSFEEEIGSGAFTDAKHLVGALRSLDKLGQFLDQLDKADTSAATAASSPATTTTTTLPTQLATSKDTQCLVCSDGTAAAVEQVGEGSCQVSGACTAAKPAEALAQARAAAAAAGTELPALSPTTVDLMALADPDKQDGAALPDLFYLQHELSVYCPSAAPGQIAAAEDCVSEAQLKQAVKGWLAAAVGVGSGYSVAAASTAVPGVAAHLVDQDFLDATHYAAPLEPGCTDGFKFNVYVTTVDGGLQQPLQDAWAAAVRDPEPLRAAAAQAAGADVCGLTAARKAAVVYPPVERMEAFQPKGLGLVGPSVVVGSGAAIAPIDHVVRGQPYSLFLQNFPAGSPVELQLVGADAALASGLEGVPLTTVGSFEDDGLVELLWSVAEDLPEGRYYVRAAAGPGGALFATSQPFSVVAAPLAGPGRRWRFG